MIFNISSSRPRKMLCILKTALSKHTSLGITFCWKTTRLVFKIAYTYLRTLSVSIVAMGRSSLSLRATSSSNLFLCISWVPWEKLNLATFIPEMCIRDRNEEGCRTSMKSYLILNKNIFNVHSYSPQILIYNNVFSSYR